MNGARIVDSGIDEHYEHAMAAGAGVVQPLHDTACGSRDYISREPEGNPWRLGSHRPE